MSPPFFSFFFFCLSQNSPYLIQELYTSPTEGGLAASFIGFSRFVLSFKD